MMMAVEVPNELLDVEGARPSGFTCDGALLDRVHDVPVGAWLAVTLEGMDSRSMTGHDLARFIESSQALINWAHGMQADAIVEWSTRPGGEDVDQEVAFALREPLQTATKRVWAARRLRMRMPQTWARLRSGQLPWTHASRAAEATGGVEDQTLLDEAERRVWAKGMRNSAAELRRAFRETLDRLNPHDADARAERARTEQTDVTFYDSDDGMSDLIASLPVEDGLLVKTTIDAEAMSAKKAGDPRRIGQLRADALVNLATHWLACPRTDTASSPPPSGKSTVDGPAAPPRLIIPGHPQPAGVTAASRPSENLTVDPAAASRLIVPGHPEPPAVTVSSRPSEKPTASRRPATIGRRPIEIGIVIGLRTALGHDQLPGEIPGHGLIPHAVIRRMIDREQPRLRLYVIDDTPNSDGRLLHYAETSYRPKTQQTRHVHAAYPYSVGPASSVPSVRCDTDHPDNWPVSPTQIEKLVPICRPWHNRKTRKRIRMTIDDNGHVTWTTRHGQSRLVHPHSYQLAWTEPAPF